MKKQDNSQKAIIRLYRQFDLDLIYVFESLLKGGTDLHLFIKKVLRNSLQSIDKTEEDKILLDKLMNPGTNETPILRRKIQYHLHLDLEEDADIIAWIEGITIGYRNTAIKETIRTYLEKPCMFPLLTTTNLNFKGEVKNANPES